MSHVKSKSWRAAARLLRPYLALYRGRIGVGLACLFAAVAMRILEPWPLQFVLDHVLITAVSGASENASAAAVSSAQREFGSPIGMLTLCAVAVVVIAALRALFEYIRAVSFAWVGNRIVADLRRDVFQHLQSLSLAFHARARRGDLTIRLVGDLNMIRDVAVTALLPLLASMMILAGMSVVMLWMHWKLGLLAIAVIPLFWVSATRSSRRIHQAAKKQRACEGQLAATVSESLSSAKVVQALSLKDHFSQAFTSSSQKSVKDGVRTSRLSAALERKVDVLIALASGLVLWQGARFVLAGELSIGQLVVFLTYLKRAFKPLQDFAKYTGRLSKALAAVDRVRDILDESPGVADRPGAKEAPRLNGCVEFQNVTYRYPDGMEALSDVSFTVNPGQCVAIVGTSGAGKSTLLSLLCRLHDPTSGAVLIDGEDLRNWKVDSLRSQQSIVMQDSAVFAMSVRDNIAIGAEDVGDEEVEAAAQLAQAHEFISELADGYQTLLGERGANLSRGQIQRIAIARATVRPKPLFLVDEPTTGLDRASEAAVVEAILRNRASRTTFVVTHQLEIAARADWVLVLDAGKIVQQGTHRQLMQRPGLYASLWKHGAPADRAHVGAEYVVGR